MSRSDAFPEIREIADAVCINQVTAEQLRKLESLLSGNFDAQHFYYDYISIHMHLNSAAERNMEFVYRRMTETTAVTEEFVIRPKKQNEPKSDEAINSQTTFKTADVISNINDTTPPSGNASDKPQNSSPEGKKTFYIKYKKRVLIILLSLLVTLFGWLSLNKAPESFFAKVIQGHVVIVEQGKVERNRLSLGQYKTSQDTTIQFENGDTLYLSNQSIFKLFNDQEIQLKTGKLKIKPQSENNIIVYGPNFNLFSKGDALSVDLTRSQPVVVSGKNTILLPARWRPTHYWSFDGKSNIALDSAGDLHGRPFQGAKRVAGLIGNGAFSFDNSESALVRIDSGGGTVVGTGTFSVIDGVTIEALIRPNYSGASGEIDQIFRKGWHDNVEIDSKELRMLLNFQNEQTGITLRPEGNFKESLSFGLYIVGQGYHELKLPLDGQDGRPNLADLTKGEIHHIVATYNVATGLKAIYIDGIKQAFYQYPPGSKVLSGGIGRAAIGNTPASFRRDKEAFSGEIDEVAFYNFSMPELVLKEHFKQVQKGNNYFGFQPDPNPLPHQLKMTLPPNRSTTLDVMTGLPSQVDF